MPAALRGWFSLLTGLLALGIELAVLLALMELPPFGNGDSDVVWALPCFGLVVLTLTLAGLLAALDARRRGAAAPLWISGLLTNALALAVPVLALAVSILRAFF